ncbi:MAG: FAD-dependent oxidoreductase, partial [Planctomycetota bacterium]
MRPQIDLPKELEPFDEHNRRLQESTHPPAWKNPTPDGRYNLVVVGAGTAGLVAAAGAAGLGAKVALVERNLLGGDCLNVGCVPSKALIRCARAAADARDGERFGVRIEGEVRVDFAAVMERMRRLRADIAPNDSAARFQGLGVDVYLGEGRFTAPDRLAIDGTELRFARALVATGARAVRPQIPGLAEAGFLTNETLFSLTERPERFAVIGGRPIRCEMAQTFPPLGSDLT